MDLFQKCKDFKTAEQIKEAGIYPDCVTAELTDIVQSADNSLKIPDAVSVGVLKRLGINFIKYCIVKPFCHLGNLP